MKRRNEKKIKREVNINMNPLPILKIWVFLCNSTKYYSKHAIVHKGNTDARSIHKVCQ